MSFSSVCDGAKIWNFQMFNVYSLNECTVIMEWHHMYIIHHLWLTGCITRCLGLGSTGAPWRGLWFMAKTCKKHKNSVLCIHLETNLCIWGNGMTTWTRVHSILWQMQQVERCIIIWWRLCHQCKQVIDVPRQAVEYKRINEWQTWLY
jgi:hypothetical protein